MAYGEIKDLIRRLASDNILHDKIFDIAKHPKYDGYQRDLASMVYKFFDKKTSRGAATFARSEILTTPKKSALENENMSNKILTEELHKPIIRKLKKERHTDLL